MIPYKVESREDTGLYNAKFGIWLFLASEVMLFGSLFSSYILLRVGSLSWPVQSDYLNVPIGALNSIILLTSSMFIIKAWSGLKENNFKKFRKFMWLTIAFAILFLGFKGFEYAQHFMNHEYPKKSVFLALYFLMTGLHALHILGGVVVNLYYVGPGSRLWKTNPQWFINRVEVAGLYWHFIDIVWIFLFSTMYLL
ncbi:MAG: heme-copper oxidase subunit III [Candidatus Omnitrophica bacterium]|nr:heme-copper oxidase subunit III [Candidatus Omnitrophota bacterium]